jgi:hypothetical protein
MVFDKMKLKIWITNRNRRVLAVEAPRFRKGSGAKEDSSPASS